MEIAKAAGFLKKYRYAIVILCLGLILMALPTGGREKPPEPVRQADSPSVEQQLEQILSRVRGAGQVQVLLTVAKGERIVYQSDDTRSREPESSQSHTVLITDSSHAQNALIVQTIAPEYQGAIVVCQGAQDPAVRLAITQAVAGVTGLGADRIAIMKMK